MDNEEEKSYIPETESSIKTISLEEVIAAEQEITTGEKDSFIMYHGARLEFRMKKISQAAFERTSKLLKKADASSNRNILEEYLINKGTGKPFTTEQIKELFTGGLVGALAIKIMEESDFNLDEIQQRNLRNFPR
jgi:hypothetical protein